MIVFQKLHASASQDHGQGSLIGDLDIHFNVTCGNLGVSILDDPMICPSKYIG